MSFGFFWQLNLPNNFQKDEWPFCGTPDYDKYNCHKLMGKYKDSTTQYTYRPGMFFYSPHLPPFLPPLFWFSVVPLTTTSMIITNLWANTRTLPLNIFIVLVCFPLPSPPLPPSLPFSLLSSGSMWHPRLLQVYIFYLLLLFISCLLLLVPKESWHNLVGKYNDSQSGIYVLFLNFSFPSSSPLHHPASRLPFCLPHDCSIPFYFFGFVLIFILMDSVRFTLTLDVGWWIMIGAIVFATGSMLNTMRSRRSIPS